MTARKPKGPPARNGFSHHRPAALAVLSKRTDLTWKEARFLGQACITVELSDLQHAWLGDLLTKSDLPPLADGGA